MLKNLPNLFTLTNLILGCCALIYIFNGDLTTAALCTVGCFIMDYADGFTARALKVTCPLGKELDSMADMVSFGVVPGAILYFLLYQISHSNSGYIWENNAIEPCFIAFPAFILSAAAGLRLAKFNLDTRQSQYFLGLSTPACTVFIMGLGLALFNDQFGLRSSMLGTHGFIYAVIGLFTWLMISEVPMFGMKLKPGGWRSNRTTILGGIFAIGLLFFLREIGLSLIIVLYILGSFLFLKNKEKF